jgi:hypothetical protein
MDQMTLKIGIYILLALAVTGCVTTHPRNITNLSLGLTKQEAIKIMGPPDSISAKGNTEYLLYSWPNLLTGVPTKQFVRIIDGRVESFGNVGDFDSTKENETKVKVEVK